MSARAAIGGSPSDVLDDRGRSIHQDEQASGEKEICSSLYKKGSA
jgi:hypothetical protein